MRDGVGSKQGHRKENCPRNSIENDDVTLNLTAENYSAVAMKHEIVHGGTRRVNIVAPRPVYRVNIRHLEQCSENPSADWSAGYGQPSKASCVSITKRNEFRRSLPSQVIVC